jgi:hypothetical protein
VYADDIAIISRNKAALEEIVLKLIEETQLRGLRINEAKTKYMEVTRTARNITNRLRI